MINFLIRIITVVLGAFLKYVAEINPKWLPWGHNAQRFVLPIVYSGAVNFESGVLWLGLTTLPMMIPLSLAYSFYSKNDAIARALWLFVPCVVAGLGPAIMGHLSWFVAVPCWIAGAWTGWYTRNKDNQWGAPLNGFVLTMQIFGIH